MTIGVWRATVWRRVVCMPRAARPPLLCPAGRCGTALGTSALPLRCARSADRLRVHDLVPLLDPDERFGEIRRALLGGCPERLIHKPDWVAAQRIGGLVAKFFQPD